ncbi:MAG TPA: POTRA domain-containing protein, partial [Bacteroidia bacterium]|nr:POTRA domain-containing protein [Bacteroidia bacterium]
MKHFFFSILFVFATGILSAQDNNLIDYNNVKEYTLVDVHVHGCQLVDSAVVKLISGLPIGEKITIPGEKTSEALDNLWKEGMFEDLRLEVWKIDGDYIWLNIVVVEKSKIVPPIIYPGLKKNESDDLNKALGHLTGTMLTEYRKRFIIETVNEHFRADGYHNCQTTIIETPQQTPGYVSIQIKVVKGKKVKIQDVFITGNKDFKIGKVRRTLKDTKQKRWYLIFKSSKYLEENLQKDEDKLLAKYHQKGYRDAKIVHDTVFDAPGHPNRVSVKIDISEGHIYKFGKITWLGNTKYSSEQLSDRLGIKTGDIYNQEELESRLYQSAQGNDVSALYMDDGYLFFQVTPVEVNVHGDSIDYEMRVYEGRQATIRNVTVVGNTKTNDKVIMREI